MPPDFAEKILQPLCIRGSRTAAMSVLRNVFKEPYLKKETKMLAKMDKPILLVHGRQDKLVPWHDSQRLYELWAESKLIIVDKCGHNPNEEHPERFNEAAVEFLSNSLSRASAKHSGSEKL